MQELLETIVVQACFTGHPEDGLTYYYLQRGDYDTAQKDYMENPDNMSTDIRTPLYPFFTVLKVEPFSAKMIHSTDAQMLVISALVLSHMTGANPWDLCNTAATTYMLPPLTSENPPQLPDTISFQYPCPPTWANVEYITAFLELYCGETVMPTVYKALGES